MNGVNVCEFCNKYFSTKGNCKAHKEICKIKKNKDLEDAVSLKNIIKEKDQELKEKNQELKEKEEQIIFLKSMLDKYSYNPTIINNNNTVNNNLTIKQLVSKLDPINFQDVKEHMENYSNNYKDQGTKGFAKFLCDHPFKDKFFTSDFSRNTIVYKTKEQNFIRDPDSSYLINRSINDNKRDILQKAIDRLNFINTKLKKSEDEDEFDEYVIKKSKLKKLISIIEDISSSRIIEDKDVSNVFRNNGINTYQQILEGDKYANNQKTINYNED
jgi:hypothetical protein